MGEQIALLERDADTSVLYNVLPLSETPYEVEVQQRFAGWLGGIALEQTVHMESLGLTERKSLADLIEAAAAGDEQALAAVRMNASTTVYEMALKAGHITTIEAEVGDEGGLLQHGHTYDAIFRNTLINSPDKQSVFYRRNEIEALNWQRLEAAIQHGNLDDYWMLEISLPPDNVSVDELKKGGIFVNTLSGVFRATTVQDNIVHTETAFTAGMSQPEIDPALPDTEQKNALAHAVKQRFDIQAVRDVLTDLGIIDAQRMGPEEMLAQPILFPKALLKDGIATFVELYDQRVSQTLDKTVFFGQEQPRQEYATFAEVSTRKARHFEPVIEAVQNDLLAFASQIKGDPNAAIKLMDERAEYQLQEAAYRDHQIDESIFGQKTRKYIREARIYYENNDVVGFMMARSRVQETSEMTRCGGGTSKDEKSGDARGSQKSGGESGGDGAGGGAGTLGVNANRGGEASLKWRSGYCRIDKSNCPEKGQRTLVAQCDVCIKCQYRYFNKGYDPTKFSKTNSLSAAIYALAA